MKPGRALPRVLIPVLIILAMTLAIPAQSQADVISIHIRGGGGSCYFKEGDIEYGNWIRCPSQPIRGNYISCECVNIGGATYSLYKLLRSANAVIEIKDTSNVIFDGQNNVIDGGGSYNGNGITVVSASNVVIGNITVRRFQGAGVYIDQGGNYVIRFSTIESNRIGVSIGGGINNVQVVNNNIRGNSIGVSINHSSVTLCLNNFISNTNDVRIGVSWASATWYCQVYNKSLGNYWDKLSNPDECEARGDKDGVCRIVNDNNIDRYAIGSVLPVPIPEPIFTPLAVLLVISLFVILSRKSRLQLV